MEGMRQAPWIDLYRTSRHKEEHPEQWRESGSYRVAQRLQNLQDFQETISSGYIMGNVKLEELGILAGLRVEQTETAGNGPLFLVTAQERARRAAWVGTVTDAEAERRRAEEWGRRTHAEGEYRNVFPGVHFTYGRRGGLVTRLSYSTSIGRPPVTSIIPNTTVNDDTQSLSVANTGFEAAVCRQLRLQCRILLQADRLRFGERVPEGGRWLHLLEQQPHCAARPEQRLRRTLRRLPALDVVQRRQRALSRLRTQLSQQFTFLPGIWRGFGVNLNYTQLETKGDYGGTVATTEVAGFRPRPPTPRSTTRRGNTAPACRRTRSTTTW